MQPEAPAPEGAEQAPMIVPACPLEGGELHRLAVTLRPAPVPACLPLSREWQGTTDDVALAQPDDGLGRWANWGYDHRGVTVRIPGERGPATRIEHRLGDGAASLSPDVPGPC